MALLTLKQQRLTVLLVVMALFLAATATHACAWLCGGYEEEEEEVYPRRTTYHGRKERTQLHSSAQDDEYAHLHADARFYQSRQDWVLAQVATMLAAHEATQLSTHALTIEKVLSVQQCSLILLLRGDSLFAAKVMMLHHTIPHHKTNHLVNHTSLATEIACQRDCTYPFILPLHTVLRKNLASSGYQLVVLLSPYMEQGDLSSEIKNLHEDYPPAGVERSTVNSLQRVLRVLFMGGGALAYLHGQNIVHRDVKPQNFLVANSGALMVADFGLSAVVADPSCDEPSYKSVGSPNYLAPELWTNTRGLSSAQLKPTDLWAFGVALYECATFRRPFHQRDIHELRSAVLARRYIRLDRIGFDLDSDLVDLVESLLIADWQRRFTIQQVLSADFSRKYFSMFLSWALAMNSGFTLPQREEIARMQRRYQAMLLVAPSEKPNTYGKDDKRE